MLAVGVEKGHVRRVGVGAEQPLQPGANRLSLSPVLGESEDLRSQPPALRGPSIAGPVVDDEDALQERGAPRTTAATVASAWNAGISPKGRKSDSHPRIYAPANSSFRLFDMR